MESEAKKDGTNNWLTDSSLSSMGRNALRLKGNADAALKAAELRLQGVELFLQAEAISDSYTEISLAKQRIKLQESLHPLRGETLQFSIDMAASDLQLALAELRAEEGGTDTEMYRCLSEYCANLWAISLRVKPRNVFRS